MLCEPISLFFKYELHLLVVGIFHCTICARLLIILITPILQLYICFVYIYLQLFAAHVTSLNKRMIQRYHSLQQEEVSSGPDWALQKAVTRVKGTTPPRQRRIRTSISVVKKHLIYSQSTPLEFCNQEMELMMMTSEKSRIIILVMRRIRGMGMRMGIRILISFVGIELNWIKESLEKIMVLTQV